jgi:hypothetical protein
MSHSCIQHALTRRGTCREHLVLDSFRIHLLSLQPETSEPLVIDPFGDHVLDIIQPS